MSDIHISLDRYLKHVGYMSALCPHYVRQTSYDDIYPYLYFEMFGGHSADIYLTYVRYPSKDICPLDILFWFSALDKCS